MPEYIRPKDPRRVAIGRQAMRSRWGPPRVIRLDGLENEQRAFIVELVEVAKRNAKPAPGDGQS